MDESRDKKNMSAALQHVIAFIAMVAVATLVVEFTDIDPVDIYTLWMPLGIAAYAFNALDKQDQAAGFRDLER